MNVRINWDIQRSKHAIERMILRGISQKEVIDAIIKGKKKKAENGTVETFIRFYSIVYKEKIYKNKKLEKYFQLLQNYGDLNGQNIAL